MNKKILIIGKAHTSKTVFITQFYNRLQKGKSKLSLYKPVNDLSSIKTAREFLANGELPQPTPTEKSVEILLPIKLGDEQIDIVYPDFGGEQINNILNTRIVDDKWVNAVKESNNWILFIRLSNLSGSHDISDVTVTPEYLERNQTEYEYIVSDQTALIELIQILLDIKEHDYHYKNKQTKLTIVLSCWDELSTEKKPREVLQNHLPLLSDLIESNWEADYLKVIGLSALGFSLTEAQHKEQYQIRGPESFGYLIYENGEKTEDITELIAESI